MKVNYLVVTTSPDLISSKLFKSSKQYSEVFDILSKENDYFSPLKEIFMEVYDHEFVSINLNTTIMDPNVPELLRKLGIDLEEPFAELDEKLNVPVNNDWNEVTLLHYNVIQGLKDNYILKFRNNILEFKLYNPNINLFYRILKENTSISYFKDVLDIFSGISKTLNIFGRYKDNRILERVWENLDCETLVTFIRNTLESLLNSTRKDISDLHSQINGLFYDIAEESLMNRHAYISTNYCENDYVMENPKEFVKGRYFNLVRLLFTNLLVHTMDEKDSLLRRNSEVLRKAFIAYFKLFINEDNDTPTKHMFTDIISYLEGISFAKVPEPMKTIVICPNPKLKITASDNSGDVDTDQVFNGFTSVGAAKLENFIKTNYDEDTVVDKITNPDNVHDLNQTINNLLTTIKEIVSPEYDLEYKFKITKK